MKRVKVEGDCWLCGKFRVLTNEHTPPRAAFNDHDILLQSIDKMTEQVGHVIWRGETIHGWAVSSLCEECNNRTGRVYGSHYVDFIRQLAEKVENVADGDEVTVVVNRPLSVLKQIMMSFVSANGPYFVKTHPWLRRFLRSSREKGFPPDWYVYAFAINSMCGRKTGITGFYDFIRKRTCVLAEFTFWPLGTVLAFQPMNDYPLVPIQQFAKYEYTDSRAGLMLKLPVNPASSAYAVDFRTKDQIMRGRDPSDEQPQATEEQAKGLMQELRKYAPKEDENHYVYSGHPSTFREARAAQKRKK